MEKVNVFRTGVGLVVLAVAAASGVSGQAAPPPSQDAVVAEVRALRVDLNQRLDASIRAQLLVARLSLQEQRINSVVKQLEDVATKMREGAAARGQAEAGLKMMGFDKMTDAQKKEMETVMGPLLGMKETMDKADAELQLRHSELSQMLMQEQARWNGFNQLLDDLERALSKPVK